MNKKVWFLSTFIILIITLATIVTKLNTAVNQEQIKKVKAQLNYVLHNKLEQERASALQYALVLSQNQALHQALIDEDEDKGYAILSKTMKSIMNHTNTFIRTQVITKDLTIFARSWDNYYAGMSLDIYRPDLNYFKKNKNPRSAIEVGRRVGFKATVPIYKEEHLLGFVEVLQFFEPLSDYFKNMGIDLFVLLDQRFYSIAVFMHLNPMLGRYILANSHYNKAYLDELKKIDFNVLQEKESMTLGNRQLFMYAMNNGEKERIGSFLFAIDRNRLKELLDKDEDLSFLLNFSRSDLYSMIKKEQIDANLLQSNYDKDLLNLYTLSSQEDKELFRQEAYDRLSEYTKDELIGLLLNYNFKKKIKGTIK